MDLLKFIIDVESLRNTCFLCFKLCDYATNIHDVIDVQDKSVDFKIQTSLRNIIKYLFPLHNFIFSKACSNCVEDLKNIYCKFQMRNIKIEKLNEIVDSINKNIPEKIPHTKNRIDIPILRKEIISNAGEIIEIGEKKIKDFKMNFTSTKLLHKRKIFMHKSQSKLCYICGKDCENPKALKSHLNSHSKEPCPYCQKELKTHAHFNKHVKSHTTNVKRKRNTTYSCGSCPYRTKNKTDLESHNNKMHLNIRPYQCKTCSKSFHKKSNLTAHLLTHNKRSTNLICELCGSDFSIKKTLIQHLKLHEGVKDYECEFCKRKFVTLSRKNEHVKRNHSNVFFICPHCPKKYTLKKDMNNHLRRAHHEILSVEQNVFTDSVHNVDNRVFD